MSTEPLPTPIAASPLASADTASPGLFHQRDFVAFWARQAFAQTGERIHQTALMWVAYQLTGSLALSGLIMIATTLPMVLLSPVTGTLADRMDRRTLMIGTDLLRFAAVALLAALAAAGHLPFAVFVAASALLSALGAFFGPASMATLPALVAPRDLLRANAVMESTIQTAGILGPALGGAIVGFAGVGAAFGVNAIAYALSCALLLAITFPPRIEETGQEPFFESLKGGFKLLQRDPTVAFLLISFACLNFFGGPIMLFLPYFAKDVFHAGAGGLGTLEAVIGGGMVLAALAWTRVGQVGRRFPIFFGAMLGVGALDLAMGCFPTYATFLVGLAGVGALIASINVVVMAFFQERVPSAEMGRFMGLLQSTCFGLMPISFGLFGMLSGVIAPAHLLAINGGLILAIAFSLFAVPGLRDA